MPGMFDVPNFDELTLVRRELALTLSIPEEMLALSTGPRLSLLTDELVLRLRMCLYSEQLPPHTVTRTAYVPATWWQQLKHEKAGRWWLRTLVRRRPVRQKPITLTATWENMAGYPWATLRTPSPEYLGAAIRLTMPATTTLTGTDDEDDD